MSYDPNSPDERPQQNPPFRWRRQEEPTEPEEDAGGDPQMDPRGGPTAGLAGGLLGSLLKNPKLLMALVFAVGAVITYFSSTYQEHNPVTDETHRVPWKPEQDVPLGLQAAPEMIAQHGGEHPDPQLRDFVSQVGNKLLRANAVGDWAPVFNQYQWKFHLLRDPETINAFALPGGQVFFTYGLFKRLETEDEIAGVLGHEIGHVIGRHSAQQMAKAKLIGGIAQSGAVLTSDGQDHGRMAQVIGAMVNMRYGRNDETQSDTLGVQFMINAKYDPQGLIKVMEVLKEASGGQRQPEFMSTHPDPGNRIEHIKQVIEAVKAGQLEGPQQSVNRVGPASDNSRPSGR
ncbi:MAG: M48 family metallopeptidase [Verrucomicrobiales bacterium]|nr:M48 family metallopeptidase [Verrucomicrobiales bacterium]